MTEFWSKWEKICKIFIEYTNYFTTNLLINRSIKIEVVRKLMDEINIFTEYRTTL